MELINTNSNDSVLDMLFDDLDPLIGSDDFVPSSCSNNDEVTWELFSDLFTSSSNNDLDLASFVKDIPDPLLDESPIHEPFSSSSNSTSSLTDEQLIDSNSDRLVEKDSVEVSSPVTNVNIFIDVDQNEASSSPTITSSMPEQNTDCSSSEEVIETQVDDSSIIIVPFYYEEVVEDVPMEIKQESNPAWPELKLAPEEKRLLDKEGITLPSCYPLTKEEERDLKRIRRKIRNKHSAQDSRKRKKVYIDGLESRVKTCTEQNGELKKKVQQLEVRNKSLVAELRRLQMVVGKYGNQHVQSSTCILVLLLSFVFIISPNLWPFAKPTKEMSPGFAPGNSRVLLWNPKQKHPLDDKEQLENLATPEQSSAIYEDVVRWTDNADSAILNKQSDHSTLSNARSSDYQANVSSEASSNTVTVELPLVS